MQNILLQLAAQTVPGGANNAIGDSGDTKGLGGTSKSSIFGDGQNDKGLVTTIINLILYVVGIIAVVMLIVGGIMYATSSGDEAKAKKARGTIVSALIGLAVAILAWTLVNFVFTSLGGTTGATS